MDQEAGPLNKLLSPMGSRVPQVMAASAVPSEDKLAREVR